MHSDEIAGNVHEEGLQTARASGIITSLEDPSITVVSRVR